MTVHELRRQVTARFGGGNSSLAVTVMSFGFKYGVPLEADLVLDVRFMTNPHYIEALRPNSGLIREHFAHAMHVLRVGVERVRRVARVIAADRAARFHELGMHAREVVGPLRLRVRGEVPGTAVAGSPHRLV